MRCSSVYSNAIEIRDRTGCQRRLRGTHCLADDQFVLPVNFPRICVSSDIGNEQAPWSQIGYVKLSDRRCKITRGRMRTGAMVSAKKTDSC